MALYKSIVFVHPNLAGTCYIDYLRLTQLSGFDIKTDNYFNISDESIFIFVGKTATSSSCIANQIRDGRKKKCLIVVWDLERPGGWSWSGEFDAFPREFRQTMSSELVKIGTDSFLKWADAVWSPDRYIVSLDPRRIHVVMGSDSRLREVPELDKKFDFCLMARVNQGQRRQKILAPIMSNPKFKIDPDSWGDHPHPDPKVRARVLGESRAILNVRQTSPAIHTPIRFALAAAYSLPVMAETLADPYPMTPEYDILMSDAGNFSSTVEKWIQRSDLPEIGKRLHELLCVRLPFRKCVEDGVRTTLERL